MIAAQIGTGVGFTLITAIPGQLIGTIPAGAERLPENLSAQSTGFIRREVISHPDGSGCDGDSYIELPPSRTTTGSKPINGVLFPANSVDLWGSEYGYCVWDTGAKARAAGCGGTTSNRLKGADAGRIFGQIAFVLISAGPDHTFQTTCNNYVDANTDVITPGGDDIIMRYTYAKAADMVAKLKK